MAAIHCHRRVVTAQPIVHRIVEPRRPVGHKPPAQPTAAGHVELAVPGRGRQADLEVDRRAHVTQHPAVLGQVVLCRHNGRGEEISVLDLQVFERPAVGRGLGRNRGAKPRRDDGDGADVNRTVKHDRAPNFRAEREYPGQSNAQTISAPPRSDRPGARPNESITGAPIYNVEY
jgi:hypothetical protein